MKESAIRVVARTGYAARGVVYLIVGSFAVLAAVGGGRTTDAKGALRELLEQPFGQVLLGLVAAGLVAHAIWRLLQGLLDADDHGRGAKALAVRGSLLVSGVVHASLAAYAASLALGGTGGGGGGEGEQGLARWLLEQPFGPYLLGAVGLAVIAAGFGQAWRGLSGRFRRTLSLYAYNLDSLAPLCAFGLVARGLVLAVVGLFFLIAALEVDPSEAGGLEAALGWLRGQPYGEALFLGVAVGLFAFGCYSLIEAACKRIGKVELSGRRALEKRPSL